MGRPRIHDADTVLRLTDAAERLLAGGGVAALSVRGVAEAAGETTRAVYSVFGGKEEMVRSLYRRGLEHFLATTAAAPRRDDAFEDVLALTLHGFRAFARAEPHLYRLIFERPLPDFAPSADDRLILREALDVLAARLQRALDLGAVVGRDAVTLAVEWSAVVQGYVSSEVNGVLPLAAGDEQFVDILRSLFLGWAQPPVRKTPA